MIIRSVDRNSKLFNIFLTKYLRNQILTRKTMDTITYENEMNQKSEIKFLEDLDS